MPQNEKQPVAAKSALPSTKALDWVRRYNDTLASNPSIILDGVRFNVVVDVHGLPALNIEPLTDKPLKNITIQGWRELRDYIDKTFLPQ